MTQPAPKPAWQLERDRRFPADVIRGAQRGHREQGIPACVTLAQWALESSFGKKTAGAFNFFGIKWAAACPFGFEVKTTHEYIEKLVDGRKVKEKVKTEARFIAFPSAEEAFAYHARHLATSKYYREAQRLRSDWRKFLHAMGKVYATDPLYRAKLLTIIEDYHLYDWNVAPELITARI